MAFDDWAKIVLHTANEDASSGSYDQILTTTLATFSGHATKEIGVMQIGHKFERESDPRRDVSGEMHDSGLRVRLGFDIECYPMTYDPLLDSWNVDDYDAICSALRAPHKWIEIVGTERTYHDTGKAIPVVALQLPEFTIERESAERIVTIALKKKFAEA